YYKHLKGEQTSTNALATIFAWSGALKKRGEIDKNTPLINYADALEKASIRTIEDGVMTKDLALLSENENKKVVNTHDFIKEIAARLEKELA
ncbi:MAG: isocitrate/isopropylmalate family dehydrogenase, partial [Christensenellaceae bacterium]